MKRETGEKRPLEVKGNKTGDKKGIKVYRVK
jgi:hypothetical protein